MSETMVHGFKVITGGLLSPAERLARAHALVEEAAAELSDVNLPGSGATLLEYALSTHLALTVGRERALRALSLSRANIIRITGEREGA